MAQGYIITGPDGKEYEIDAPAGATQDQIMRFAQEALRRVTGGQQQAPQPQRQRQAPQTEPREKVPWTSIPPASTGRQVEGASILPLGRYMMPDGSQQVSFGLPQPVLDAYRSMRQGLGFEQDPAAPQGYVSEESMIKGAIGGAGVGMTGNVPMAAARGAASAGPRLAERAAMLNRNQRAPQLTVPKALDPNPGVGSQAAAITAQRTTGLPFLGAPTRKAAEQGADALRDRFNFSTGLGAAIAPAADDVGRAIKRQSDTYVGQVSKDSVSFAYDRIKDTIPQGYKGKLPELTKLFNQLKAEQAESTSRVAQPVIDKIQEAVSRGSLSVKGAEELKRELSKLGNPQLAIGDAATAGPQFKRAAKALNKDISAMIKDAGGATAQKAVADAKELFVLTTRARRAAQKFVGKNLGDDAIAGETVLSRMYSAAGSSSSADATSLLRFKKLIDAPEWRRAGRALHDKMARGQDGEPNLLQWSKNFMKLSPMGRQALYGKEASELAQLAKFTTEYMRKFNAMGNPSKSGDLAAILAGVAALSTQPVGALLTGGKILAVSKIMAQPRRVRALKTVLKLGRRDSLNRAQQATLRAAMTALTVDQNSGREDGQ